MATGCDATSDNDDPEQDQDAEILTTQEGIQFVRTPEERFILKKFAFR